jgi:hypothetical protein
LGHIKTSRRMRWGLAPSAVSVSRLKKADASLTGRVVAIGPDGVSRESRDDALSANRVAKHLNLTILTTSLLKCSRYSTARGSEDLTGNDGVLEVACRECADRSVCGRGSLQATRVVLDQKPTYAN